MAPWDSAEVLARFILEEPPRVFEAAEDVATLARGGLISVMDIEAGTATGEAPLTVPEVEYRKSLRLPVRLV